MLRIIGLKLLKTVPVLLVVSLATFFMLELVPGDPALAVLGEDATQEQLEQVRHELGLDRPLFERYIDWMGDTLTGDMGQSLRPPVQDVSDMITFRLPVTIEIALLALSMSLVISIPLALVAAYRPGGRFDRLATGAAFGLIAVPGFLAGLLLIFLVVFQTEGVRWVAALGLPWAAWLLWRAVVRAKEYPPGGARVRPLVFGLLGAVVVAAASLWLFTSFPEFPRQGFSRLTDEAGIRENLKSAFLPALTLALTEIAVFMRLLRGDLITTLQEDFILSARAKGMPTWRILIRDALRPSSFSLITVAGVVFGRLIGGTSIVETIFNLPGMGTLIINSIGAKDYPVVQGAVLTVAVFYVVLNAVVDISYSYLDPRIRRGRV